MAYNPLLNPHPISGTVTANAGTGTMTVSGTVTANAGTGSMAVTGTFWQATQPVSGTVTANAGTGTFAISAASLPLPAGASTETTLAALNTKIGAAGQATMAASTPVVIASNQSALPVTGTFFQATQPVSIATMPTTPVTGTFWQATQPVSLATNTPTIAAGTALIGKVGIDQTTPGTTNAVAISTVGTVALNAFPAGFQRVTDEPRQLFYDPFDAALDTTDRWNTATAAGGGVASTTTTGVMTTGSGTTANGYSLLTSRNSFLPTIPGWLGNSWAIQIEAGATAGNNAVRFWGHGLPVGTPTSASPFGTGNAYGFEIDIAGVLQAVVYASGTRTVVSSLATLQPTDGAMHRYICFYRTDRIYWYIDGLGSAQLGATSNFQGPNIQSLPVCVLSIAHSAAPAASREIKTSGLAVWDTAKNNSTISDGTFPWRKATIKPASTAALATDTPLVVALHPTSPLPAGTATLGTTMGPTLTKGTQGITGYSTQDLKDAGRTLFSASVVIAGVTAVTTEALLTMVPTRAGVASATATTIAVTSGKTLRITGISVGMISTGASVLSMRFALRMNPSGAVAATSPILRILPVPSGAALAQAGGYADIEFTDGLEFTGTQQIGITQIGSAVTGTCWVSITGFEY